MSNSNAQNAQVNNAETSTSAETESQTANNLPVGKLVTLMSEITGLSESEVLILGLWVMQNKDTLINKAKTALEQNLSEETAFNLLFSEAPVKPDYKIVVTQIESKLFALLEKACVIIDKWISPEVGKEVREEFVKHYSEFKKDGESTDWKTKFEHLSAKFQDKITDFRNADQGTKPKVEGFMCNSKTETKGGVFNW